MEIKITGEAKEIAALVLAVQERQISVDEIMKQIADQIREAGMRPGIWTSPFIAHETATTTILKL